PWLGIVPVREQSPPAGPAPVFPWSYADEGAWQALWTSLNETNNLKDLAALEERARPHVENVRAAVRKAGPEATQAQFDGFVTQLHAGAAPAAAVGRRLDRLADRYDKLAMEMDFKLTYDAQRRLFAVGWNQDDGRLDRARYDLLASEARIASLVG